MGSGERRTVLCPAERGLCVHGHRLWTWANQQNSNCGGCHLLPSCPADRLTAPARQDCRKLRPCHAFASIHYLSLLSGQTTAFGVLDPSKYAVFACYPKCPECPKCTRCTLLDQEEQRDRGRDRESETLPCCTLFCRTSKHLVGLENKWVCWSFFVCCTRLPFAGNIQFSTDFRHP